MNIKCEIRYNNVYNCNNSITTHTYSWCLFKVSAPNNSLINIDEVLYTNDSRFGLKIQFTITKHCCV